MKFIFSTFLLTLVFVFKYYVAESGPSKCYLCQGICKNPIETIECPPQSRCVANGVIYDSEHRIEQKACIPINDTAAEKCAKVNREKGAFCYLCDTDLCNLKGFDTS